MSVIAVANDKGGQGKSSLVAVLGPLMALKGHNVVIIDLDPQPGQTDIWATFEETWNAAHGVNKPSFREAVEREPDRTSVNRLFLQPDMGLGGISYRVPLDRVLDELGAVNAQGVSIIPRIDNHGLHLATLRQDTIKTYGIDPNHIGELLVVPNSGTLYSIVKEAEARKGTNSAFKIQRFLANAIKLLIEQGLVPQDTIFLLDIPGERNVIPEMAYYAADVVISPMEPIGMSLTGTVNTARDVRKIRIDRADSQGRPWFSEVILNRGGGHDYERKWLSYARSRLKTVDLTLSSIEIPISHVFRCAGQVGTPPFFHDPLDTAIKAIAEYCFTKLL